MTELERSTLADGFRLCLLGAATDRAQGALEYHASLFDGGRRVDTVRHRDRLYMPQPGVIADLRRCLLHVLAAPNVLVVYGNGWRELIAQAVPPAISAELRVLDLKRTAIALYPGPGARAGIEEIARACGIGPVVVPDAVGAPVYENVLWAVIGAGGRRGLTWPRMLEAADLSLHRPALETYAFDQETLAVLPRTPGVYVMRDAHGRTLYVGKAANLNRRLNDYFRAVREIPDKLADIRKRIHDFEYQLVGSELEALLLENRRISEMDPGVNVQRKVAEGASRYPDPLLPVVVICPSTRPGHGELFFFGSRGRAVQCLANPKRPPRKVLAAMVDYFCRGDTPFRPNPRVTDWGVEGNEICRRYFGRFRARLNWIEVSRKKGAAGFVRELTAVLKSLDWTDTEPGEFRLA